jgi:hypothetical protein
MKKKKLYDDRERFNSSDYEDNEEIFLDALKMFFFTVAVIGSVWGMIYFLV